LHRELGAVGGDALDVDLDSLGIDLDVLADDSGDLGTQLLQLGSLDAGAVRGENQVQAPLGLLATGAPRADEKTLDLVPHG
jgi:hypothetical protein